jgi:hypothetical protein
MRRVNQVFRFRCLVCLQPSTRTVHPACDDLFLSRNKGERRVLRDYDIRKRIGLRLKLIVPRRCKYEKAILTQAAVGWEVATTRGTRRCPTRQETYCYLQDFMRRADAKRNKQRRRK